MHRKKQELPLSTARQNSHSSNWFPPLEISRDVSSHGLQKCFRIYTVIFVLLQLAFFNIEEFSARFESHVKVTLYFSWSLICRVIAKGSGFSHECLCWGNSPQQTIHVPNFTVCGTEQKTCTCT